MEKDVAAGTTRGGGVARAGAFLPRPTRPLLASRDARSLRSVTRNWRLVSACDFSLWERLWRGPPGPRDRPGRQAAGHGPGPGPVRRVWDSCLFFPVLTPAGGGGRGDARCRPRVSVAGCSGRATVARPVVTAAEKERRARGKTSSRQLIGRVRTKNSSEVSLRRGRWMASGHDRRGGSRGLPPPRSSSSHPVGVTARPRRVRVAVATSVLAGHTFQGPRHIPREPAGRAWGLSCS